MVNITTFRGVKTSGRHIITLKGGVAKEDFISQNKLGANTVYKYGVINAFAGRYDKATLDTLCKSEKVERISEDPAMRLCTVQNNAPWGLSRLSRNAPIVVQAGQNAGGPNFQYEYQGTAAQAGAGVDIYILDSGVRHTHEEFLDHNGNHRAQWGATFYEGIDGNNNLPQNDDQGHGTHCAGIAAGNDCGVAKGANIISVKICHDTIPYPLDAIRGLDWVRDRIAAAGGNKRPSVVSMSLAVQFNFPELVAAVTTLTNAGIHVVASASDGRIHVPGDGVPLNANTSSPGNAPTAITVGYTRINDNMVEDCFYGDCVDLFAPGVNIRSAWHTGNNAYVNIGGTSMAAPYVAGLVAYRISRNGNLAPAAMKAALVAAGTPHAVLNIPQAAVDANTTDVLAHN